MLEVPYVFGKRLSGESKLDTSVNLDFLLLLADKIFGDFVPVRYALYSLIGFIGIAVHMAVLATVNRVLSWPIESSQAVATCAAIGCNFLLNNQLTYRDRKLKGPWRILKGLTVYGLGCSVGVFASVAVADLLTKDGWAWYLAGLGGIVVGSVWNFRRSPTFSRGRYYGDARLFTGLLWRSANKIAPSDCAESESNVL